MQQDLMISSSITNFTVQPIKATGSQVQKWQSKNIIKELTSDIVAAIFQEWISKDKVRKLLGIFATVRWTAKQSGIIAHYQ